MKKNNSITKAPIKSLVKGYSLLPNPSLLSTILNEQLVPSVGCTELSALAYASALAYHILIGKIPAPFQISKPLSYQKILPHQIKRIIVTVDRNVYKNGFVAQIPVGKNLKGLAYAAALGIFGNPSDKLTIFKQLTKTDTAQAINLIHHNKIEIKTLEDREISPYFEVQLLTKNNSATVVIEYQHFNVSLIKRNNRIIHQLSKQSINNSFSPAMKELGNLSLAQLVHLVEYLTAKDKQHIRNSLQINQRLSQYGLKHYRNGLTGSLQNLVRRKILNNDLVYHAQLDTASAVETRMSGVPLEVMSLSGSGNQGLTALLPVGSVAQNRGLLDEERLVKSLALSCLVTAYTTYHIGYLTPLCGCIVKAGVGAAAGIAYYLKGRTNQIDSTIKNMLGSSAGIICDGAKVGCALKVANATYTAIESALLGLNNISIPKSKGLITYTTEQSVRNLGIFSRAMTSADKTLVNILSAQT
ncbi:MAG: L-serine ammonia-lyase, iron-sulfur-dependent, subunit alpha [Planctomycetota bacterium]